MPTGRVYIKHFKLICFFVFFLFFKPAQYIIGSELNTLINYIVLLVSIALACFGAFLKKFGYRMNRFCIPVFFLYFWCLLGSSAMNSLRGYPIDYSGALVSFSHMLSLVLICDIGLWYSPKKLLNSFLSIGIFVCSINALTLFMYYKRGGMNPGYTAGELVSKYYFLGTDNQSYFWTWPVLVVTWMYYFMFNAKRGFLSIAVGFTLLVSASYIYTWSVLAAIACILVPCCALIFIRRIGKQKKVKKEKKTALQFSLLWKIAVVIDTLIPTGVLLNYVVLFSQSILRKSATLSRRILIWERSIQYILKSPLIGYGNEPMSTSISKLLVNHTHNLLLETLYRGGIIGLLLFVLTMYALSKRTKVISGSTVYLFLSVMVFVFLVCSSMYFAYYRYHFLILMLIMAHTELFENAPTHLSTALSNKHRAEHYRYN